MALKVLREYLRDNADMVRRFVATTRLEGCAADTDLVALAKDCLAREQEDRPRNASTVAERITAHLAGVQERLRTAEVAWAAEAARAEEATHTAAEANERTRAERHD